MPLIYRSMTREGDKPKVGETARTLGVRPGKDIVPDGQGIVHPETGGMSVVPSWRALPSWRIPQRLRQLVPDARGKNDDACWRLGEGPFENSLIFDRLNLRLDAADHALVEPAGLMPLNDFQEALAGTQASWKIDES